jgi:hypothetical protein
LATLRRYLVRRRIVTTISQEHLRRVLQSLGITAPRTRTWKWSNDPLYEQKKGWVLAAYKGAEAGTLDGVVDSFDECGPISLTPHAGHGWFPRGRPSRQRATYNRHHGVRKLPGAYDVGADRLWGHLEKRRVTAAVVLEFLRDIRRRYPAEVTVYIVMDNLSAHWTAEIRRWAVNNNVGLLPTPTNARHLNRIECHFWAYDEFVINGSHNSNWTEFSTPPRPTSAAATTTATTPASSSSRTGAESPDHYRRNDPRHPTSSSSNGCQLRRGVHRPRRQRRGDRIPSRTQAGLTTAGGTGGVGPG